MFGLLFATISMMVQAGFVLGMGILLDTFLVRTVTVPAIAAMVGRANWWPSRFRPQRHAPARRASPATATQGPVSETPGASEQLSLDLPSSVAHSDDLLTDHSHEPLPGQASLNAQSIPGSTSHRLKINSLGGREQIRVAPPPSADHRHRKHAQRNYEHLAHQFPPQVRINGLPEEHTTTALENTLDGPMPANGQHPAEANGEQPVGEHEMPLCEGWNCLGPSPLECVSKVRCARADRQLIVQSGASNNDE
jgi:hypothetical protein